MANFKYRNCCGAPGECVIDGSPSVFYSFLSPFNHSTGHASQHIWCLSRARIKWEGCRRKGIWHINGG